MSAAQQDSAETQISAQQGSLQNLQDTVAFLQEHAPYSGIAPKLLQTLLARAVLRFLPAGTVIDYPAERPPPVVSVVYQGRLIGRLAVNQQPGEFPVTVGDTLHNVAVFEQRPARACYTCERDCFLIDIPAAEFLRMVSRSPELQRFCQRRGSELIDLALAGQRRAAALQLQGQDNLEQPVATLARREPLCCNPDTPINEVVRLMHEAGVGSIIVGQLDTPPQGIFTLHDLRRLVALQPEAVTGPVAAAMSANPACIDYQQPAFEAAALMANGHFRHLPVTREGRLWGVLSERDLFAMQRGSLVQLSRDLSRASDIEGLAELRLQVSRVAQQMLAHGASARQLTTLITHLNDTATRRCIELVTADRPWPVPVIWLAFGSEGRGEQTLATDQDNGLAMLTDEPEAHKPACLEISRAINHGLDQIGFPLCRGNTMASNPELCLSLAQWRQRFERIVASPTPQHLLDACVLLDARATHGPAEGWHTLMVDVRDMIRRNGRFAHALAQHALEWRPALNLIGRLKTEKVDDQRVLNLKKGALQPMITAARVLAISHGIAAVNTEDRFRALAEGGHVSGRDAKAWIEAFAFVQLQRMNLNREQMERGEPMDNDLDLRQINPLDIRILREALRQAGRLQQRLELDFPER